MNEKKNIFRRFFEKRNNDSNLLDPKQWLLNALGIRKSYTGINVTEVSAMNLSVVYACVRIISETIASLPLNVYKRLKVGKEKATDHPLYRALHLRPNADMTSFAWRELMGVDLNTWGNSYNIKLRNSTGSVIGFYPMIASRMNVEIKNNDVIYTYTFADNIQRIVPRRDVLHIPGLSFNGIIGKSPITMAREAIGLGLALEEFGARFFSNGTNIGAVAQHPGRLTKQGSENLRESLNEVYQGLGNSHKLMLLEEGMTINKVTIPPNDAQFLETRVFQIEEICRFYRMQLHKVQNLRGATFSNIEHQAIEHVVDTIRPWLVRIEQGINSDPELFDDQHFCEFVVDGLLRGDVATRWEAYSKAFNIGTYSPNDILEMENKNPYDGGDKHWIQLNMQPIENAATEPIIQGASNTKAIENRDILAERLAKAYKPLLYNALIRIIKREKTDLFKISKAFIDNKDSELLKNNILEFYKKHDEFIKSQIKPVIYAFSEALGAENNIKISDITIFANSYSEDFTDRYTEDMDSLIKPIGNNDFEEVFNELTENKPEELSSIEMPRISTAFERYIIKIGQYSINL